MAGSVIDEKDFRNLVQPSAEVERCPFCKHEIILDATVCGSCNAYAKYKKMFSKKTNTIIVFIIFSGCLIGLIPEYRDILWTTAVFSLFVTPCRFIFGNKEKIWLRYR